MQKNQVQPRKKKLSSSQLDFISSLKQAWFKKSKVKLNITKKEEQLLKYVGSAEK